MRRPDLKIISLVALMLGGAACNSSEEASYLAEPEVGSALPDTSSVQRAAAGPTQTVVVNPASDPVKTTVLGPVTVQGSTSVSGAVTCNQAAPYEVTGSVDIGSPTVNAVLSGVPAVTLSGEPTVTVAPGITERAYLNNLTIPAGGVVTPAVATSPYEEIRVVFMSNCATCSLTLRFFIENMLIDETTVDGARIYTQNFRVPGTSFLIEMGNPGAAQASVKLAVFGRP